MARPPEGPPIGQLTMPDGISTEGSIIGTPEPTDPSIQQISPEVQAAQDLAPSHIRVDPPRGRKVVKTGAFTTLVTAGAMVLGRIFSPDGAAAQTVPDPAQAGDAAHNPGYGDQSGIVYGQADETATPTPTESSAQLLAKKGNADFPLLIVGQPNFKGVPTAGPTATGEIPVTPTNEPPTATAELPITPTQEEPTPTEILQKPLRLDNNDPVTFANTGLPFWEKSGTLAGVVEGDVTAKYIGSMVDGNNNPEKHKIEIGGKQVFVQPDVPDKGAIINTKVLPNSEFNAFENESITPDKPYVMSNNNPDTVTKKRSFYVPKNRVDQEVRINIQMSARETGVEGNWGSGIQVANGAHFVALDALGEKWKFVKSDSVGQKYQAYILPDLNNVPIEMRFDQKNDRVTLIDSRTGKNINLSDDRGRVFPSVSLKDYELKNVDYWMIRDSLRLTSDVTISRLKYETSTDPNSENQDVEYRPELEIGNGLADNPKVALPMSEDKAGPFNTPLLDHFEARNNGAKIVDFGYAEYLFSGSYGDPSKPIEFDDWDEQQTLSTISALGLRHTGIPIDVVHLPSPRANKESVSAIIELIAENQPDNLEIPIRGMFDPNGSFTKEGELIKAYGNDGSKMFKDIVSKTNAVGKKSSVYIPKSDTRAMDSMFAKVQNEGGPERISSMRMDIAKLSTREAMDRLLTKGAEGYQMDVVNVADNQDGRSAKDEFYIAAAAGARLIVVGFPEITDPTQQYAFTIDENAHGGFEIKYTPDVYNEMVKASNETNGVKGGQFAVSSLIQQDPLYFAEMMERSDDKSPKYDKDDKRFDQLQKLHPELNLKSVIKQAVSSLSMM